MGVLSILCEDLQKHSGESSTFFYETLGPDDVLVTPANFYISEHTTNHLSAGYRKPLLPAQGSLEMEQVLAMNESRVSKSKLVELVQQLHAALRRDADA